MKRSACLDVVTRELSTAGVPYRVEMGGKHPRVRYGDNFARSHTVSGSPSDVRAWKNERAAIRRVIRSMVAA